jgi:hypothetical protein
MHLSRARTVLREAPDLVDGMIAGGSLQDGAKTKTRVNAHWKGFCVS